MTPRSLLKIIASVACAAAPGVALAHIGNDAGLHHGSGFLAGTILLHLSGIGVGLTPKSRTPWPARLLGGGVAVFGTVLLARLAAG